MICSSNSVLCITVVDIVTMVTIQFQLCMLYLVCYLQEYSVQKEFDTHNIKTNYLMINLVNFGTE